MPGGRLVLLTSADDYDSTRLLRSCLESWCRAGLLGLVAWARAADLARDAAGTEYAWADGRRWTLAPLSTVVSGGLAELWLVALRGAEWDPEAPGATATEEGALTELNRLFGKAVTVRSLTVAATGPSRGFSYRDFSPMWDLHLVHDRRVTPDERSATEDSARCDPLSLCAAAALCATGGWSGAEAGIDLIDPVDGPVKRPRIVHAQQRVLHAPDPAFLGVPSSPPWPTPVAAGVRRALTGSLPPLHVARDLAKQCRFECAPVPTDGDEPDAQRSLWSCLFGPLPTPHGRTHTEEALVQLAQRTGGWDAPDSGGMVRPRLNDPTGTDSIADLVGHIQQSGFPIGQRAAGAEGATPEAWQMLRGTFFSLVDGSRPPAGAPTVRSSEGRDGERLVWSDPSSLAPSSAPEEWASPSLQAHRDRETAESATAGASASAENAPAGPAPPRTAARPSGDSTARPVAPGVAPGRRSDARTPRRQRRSRSRRSDRVSGDNPQAVQRSLDEIARDLGFDSEADGEASQRHGKHSRSHKAKRARATETDGMAHETTGPAVRVPERGASSAPSARASKKRRRGRARTKATTADAWFTSGMEALPAGGDHDTLMSRLAAILDAAMSSAHGRFRHYAALRPPRREYEQARRRRRRARTVLAASVLVAAAAVAVAVDQRWPYLAVAWEAATPWRARPLYGPEIWPVASIAAGVVVVSIAGLIFIRAASRLRDAMDELQHAENLRKECAGNSAHYASELLRLHSLSEQFADHRRIITEILHRPFGDPEKVTRNRLDADGLRFDPAPPPSMLVGAANASDERVAEEYRRLQRRLTQRGWMNSVYRDVLEAWSAEYRGLEPTERPDPDADASSFGSAMRRDGTRNLDARAHFTRAVVSDGWAVTAARRTRWSQSLGTGDGDDDATQRYLALLEAPFAVHGPVQVASDASGFLDLGGVGETLAGGDIRHRFGWTDVLRPSAAVSPPDVGAFGSGTAPVVVAPDDSGAMVLMSWRLEYSEQVSTESLRSWTDVGSRPEPAPSGGVI